MNRPNPHLHFPHRYYPGRRRTGLKWVERVALRYQKKQFPNWTTLLGMPLSSCCFIVTLFLMFPTLALTNDLPEPMSQSAKISAYILTIMGIGSTLIGVLALGIPSNIKSIIDLGCLTIAILIAGLTLVSGTLVLIWLSLPYESYRLTGYYRPIYNLPDWYDDYLGITGLILIFNVLVIGIFWLLRLGLMLRHIPLEMHWRKFLVMVLLAMLAIFLINLTISIIIIADGPSGFFFGGGGVLDMIFGLLLINIFVSLYFGTIFYGSIFTLFLIVQHLQVLWFLIRFNRMRQILANPHMLSRKNNANPDAESDNRWMTTKVIIPAHMKRPPKLSKVSPADAS